MKRKLILYCYNYQKVNNFKKLILIKAIVLNQIQYPIRKCVSNKFIS